MVDQQGQDPFEDRGKGRFENFGKRVDERVSQAFAEGRRRTEKGDRLSQRSSGASATAGLGAGAARCRGTIAQIGRTARRRSRQRSALGCRGQPACAAHCRIFADRRREALGTGCRHKASPVAVAPPPALSPAPAGQPRSPSGPISNAPAPAPAPSGDRSRQPGGRGFC